MPKQKLFELMTDSPGRSFELVRTHPSKAIARAEMERVFSTFTDPDGNFVEQFQTTGFDARVVELYLHAVFEELGMTIERPSAPDFVLESAGTRFAVEATTSNPSTSGALHEHGRHLEELSTEERARYLEHEWPVRLGGPLFAKLKKKYWALPVLPGAASRLCDRGVSRPTGPRIVVGWPRVVFVRSHARESPSARWAADCR